MPVPPNIAHRVNSSYPCPQIHPDWLEGCYEWVINEHHLDPTTDQQAIFTHIEKQLLSARLDEVAQPGTGFPEDILAGDKRVKNILVELTAITEIGHSAFNLQNVFQARTERAEMGEIEAEVALEDEGPVSKYPRSMLKLELSDGHIAIQGIEYRPLPQLELGETHLGFKMILKDVPIHNGVAFLEASNVVFKGGFNAEYDAEQDSQLARSFRIRLGLPVADGDLAGSAPIQQGARPPLQEMKGSLAPTPEPARHQHSDDENQPRRRRIPSHQPPSIPSTPNKTAQRQPTLTESPYFSRTVQSQTNGRVIATNSRVVSATHSILSIRSDDDGEDDALTAPPNAPRPSEDDEISCEFDDGEEFDADFMAGIDAAESAAMAAAHAPQGFVISDEDDDDKENQAVPLRHVRRRVMQEEPDVIELSD